MVALIQTAYHTNRFVQTKCTAVQLLVFWRKLNSTICIQHVTQILYFTTLFQHGLTDKEDHRHELQI
jgi:hypothetical protein